MKLLLILLTLFPSVAYAQLYGAPGGLYPQCKLVTVCEGGQCQTVRVCQ